MPDSTDGTGSIARRRVLQAAGAGTIGLAGCTGGGGDTPTPRVRRETVVQERTVVKERTVIREATPDLVSMRTLDVEGALIVPVYLYGINNGAFRQNGIDLELEVAAFGKYVRQVTSGLSHIGGLSVPPVIEFINNGEDLTMLGNQLNFFNQMLAKRDSDIDDPSDLGDKSLGIPFQTSTTTLAYRGIIQDEYDFDILNDPASVKSSPPPVLWNLLLEDEVDAVIEFSGFTIRGAANPDIKTVFDPVAYWRDRYGYPPPATSWTVYRSWVEDNADLALRFIQGWNDAVRMFTEDIDEALRNYGRLGGVTTEGQADVIRAWTEDDIIFGPYDYPQDLADNNWELIEMIHETGSLASLPDKDDALTPRSALESMANR